MGELPPGQPPKYPRSRVMNVDCPACGAGPGIRCMGVGGPRTANHLERVWRYHEWARDQGRRER